MKMFAAKDKNGAQIFLRDTVKYEAAVDDMGLLGTEEGQVLGIPSEQKVQVQPLGGGAPSIFNSEDVEVTYSLVGNIATLASNEELQELVLKAEIRYGAAVAASKKPRAKRGSGTTRAKAAPKMSKMDMLLAKKKKEEEDML